jgi:penicillin-binding protein 1C
MKYIKYIVYTTLLILGLLYFSIPRKIFDKPKSHIIFSRNGELLSARIASDGQWRFPASNNISTKIEKCILAFEDEYFYYHPGFNPVSISKAVYGNLKSGKIKRGGSTISMQTVRLWLGNPERTYFQKIKELFLVLGLEMNFSKKEILQLYLNNAPFGGNIVGVETASWRYFNRESSQLSWAEAATLAVLPNSPALIHLGRNRDKLETKRNFLLRKLYKKGVIDRTTYELSLFENIPEKTYSTPNLAPHLLQYIKKKGGSAITKTTIDYNLQNRVLEIGKKHIDELSKNKIFNFAVVVIDIKSNEVLSYVGNSHEEKSNHSNYVDIIQSARSTGSILKPFLYLKAYDKGLLLPNTILADIPTSYNGFSPLNYDGKYYGAVPAGQCLARSLNIPAVRLLKEYGGEMFYQDLQDLHLTNVNRGANVYGLSMILGGAECSLWNLSRAYSWLARNQLEYEYGNEEYLPLIKLKTKLQEKDIILNKNPFASRGSVHLLYEQLREVNRPEGETGWTNFSSSSTVAWKTGTSHGFRDAWSIGWTSDKLVAVWVGNADGEGRPGILGVRAAAPIMFDVFSLLRSKDWFPVPHEDLVDVEVCARSGMRAGEYCKNENTIQVPESGKKTSVCKYCKLIHVDDKEQYRVNSDCYPVSKIKSKSYFVLPSVQAWYYKKVNVNYVELPPWREGCREDDIKVMQWIYPSEDNKIFIPKNRYGEKSVVVFKLAHQKRDAIVYWHLDGEFKKETERFHVFSFSASLGKHTIKCVDTEGNILGKTFEIVNK